MKCKFHLRLEDHCNEPIGIAESEILQIPESLVHIGLVVPIEFRHKGISFTAKAQYIQMI